MDINQKAEEASGYLTSSRWRRTCYPPSPWAANHATNQHTRSMITSDLPRSLRPELEVLINTWQITSSSTKGVEAIIASPVSEKGSELNPHKSRTSTYCLINPSLTIRAEPNQALVADVENHDSISIRQPSLNQKHWTTILKSKTLEIVIVKKDKS